ncbi:MAG: hypothetical protein HYY16_00865 [Planctomycetes bacterium]|nr:hypothetical protein [Planctomycetota bacterium]
MNPPQIMRVFASVRIPSSYGPDVDYEIVYAVVNSGADQKATHESVLVRLVVANTPQNVIPDILVEDLPAVQAQWTRFVLDVLWRRAQTGDTAAQIALQRLQPSPSQPPSGPTPSASTSTSATPVISASGGRFGKGDGTTPIIPVHKEKKKSEGPPVAPIIPGISSAPGSRKYFGKIIEDPQPVGVAAPPAEPKKLTIDRYEVIAFNLSAPPTADVLLRPVQSQSDELIVVAPMALVPKVEEFIKGVQAGTVKGRPTTFNPIVIRRGDPKKLPAEIAGGIARMLGDPHSALWILPDTRP